MFFKDPGSVLFASDAEPVFVADCTLMNDGYLGRKTRRRRQAACQNPAADVDPNLRLPTLDQIFPSGMSKDPPRPKTPQEKEAEEYSSLTFRAGVALRLFNLLWGCSTNEQRICESGDSSDVQLDENGRTYALKNTVMSKSFCSFSFFFSRMRSCKSPPIMYESC